LLHPQGQNLEQEAIDALAHSHVLNNDFSLGEPQEYRNDLVQPAFLAAHSVPQAKSTTIMKADVKKPDPEGPATEEQWARHNKMVA